MSSSPVDQQERRKRFVFAEKCGLFDSCAVLFQVPVGHDNIVNCFYAVGEVGLFGEKDIVMQVARCSFDAHISDILGTLFLGASIVMLHPEGVLDLKYLADILQQKQVTAIDAVPTLMRSLMTFLKQDTEHNSLKFLRSIICAGMDQRYIIDFDTTSSFMNDISR